MYFNDMIDRKRWGERLKRAILEQHGSVHNYAVVTGQVEGTIYAWLNGTRMPELSDAIANCYILSLPIEYVFCDLDFEKRSSVDNNRFEKDELQMEIDEYENKARNRFPNILLSDISLLAPFINPCMFYDLLNRISDYSDGAYLYSLFRIYVQRLEETVAGKYCLYELQKRNSPLAYKTKPILLSDDEELEYRTEYYRFKKNFYERMMSNCNVIESLAENNI